MSFSLPSLRWALFVLVLLIVVFTPSIGYLTEQPPIRWTNSPFPTQDPVTPDQPLKTYVSRCNDWDRPIGTTVVRRLVNAKTGVTTTLVLAGGIVDPGCSDVTGGIGLPQSVAPGRYYIEQLVHVSGRWREFDIPLRTQTFTVVPSAVE